MNGEIQILTLTLWREVRSSILPTGMSGFLIRLMAWVTLLF